MADRGFTIIDLLKKLYIDLNISPFLKAKGNCPQLKLMQEEKLLQSG